MSQYVAAIGYNEAVKALETKQTLTRKEAAAHLGVTIRTVDRYHQQGRLEAIKQESPAEPRQASVLFSLQQVELLYAALLEEKQLVGSLRERAKEAARKKERERASRLVRFQLEDEELEHLKASAEQAGESMGGHARSLMKDRLYGGADDADAPTADQDRKLREALYLIEKQREEVEAMRTSLIEVLSFLLAKATAEPREKAKEKLKEFFPPREEG